MTFAVRPVSLRGPLTSVILPFVLALSLVAVAGTAAATTGTVTSPDAAGTPGDGATEQRTEAVVARNRVDRLRSDIARLEIEASTAVEAYNTAHGALQDTILAEFAAQSELDTAQRRSRETRAAAERRIRSLYRAGPGTGTVLVLLSGDPLRDGPVGAGLGDMAVTLRTTRSLLASDVQVTRSARVALDTAVATSTVVLEHRAARVAAQLETQQRSDAVEAALAGRRASLAAADAELVATLERERRAADAAAVAWALSERSAATSTAPVPGTTTNRGTATTGDVTAFLAQAVATTTDPVAAAAIAAATSRLGLPYTWGATGPTTFDCSGLTQWAYAQAGLRIPRTSRQQYAGLTLVAATDVQPGDLLFYGYDDTPGSIHHVGLYVGAGLMIQAPRTGDVVRVGPIDRMPLFGAVRPSAPSA